MNEHDDIICQVRESFDGLRMDMPEEAVFARSRARRRRRLSGVTAAAAVTAGTATALTLTLGGSAPALGGSVSVSSGPASARSGNPPQTSGQARLAAFSVTSGPGESSTLIVHKGPQYPQADPGALREALAQHGIPALVTAGTFCRSTPAGQGSFSEVLHPLTAADGSDEMVIDGQAIPSGTRLSIGLFPQYTRMALIKDGAPLSCGSTSHQPAVHLLPSGTPIHQGQAK
jgi:hypothetical protein